MAEGYDGLSVALVKLDQNDQQVGEPCRSALVKLSTLEEAKSPEDLISALEEFNQMVQEMPTRIGRNNIGCFTVQPVSFSFWADRGEFEKRSIATARLMRL